jgi:AraC-like DNA-binding protein
LTHLQRNYHDPALSLLSVAKALQCNPRYLTSRFTRVVGEHMHSYLVTLRVSRACHLLVTTNQHVKVIAVTSGFSRPGGMTRAFRTHVGVSAMEYRRLFASP